MAAAAAELGGWERNVLALEAAVVKVAWAAAWERAHVAAVGAGSLPKVGP